MEANPGKCQMFLRSKIDNSKIIFATENKQTKCKRDLKLLGITIDEKFTFKKHTANISSQQQVKNFDKNKEIPIDGTNKIFI